VKTDIKELPKADKSEPKHVGATMPGTVIKTLCSKGDKVNKGDYLLITEAMKMETTIQAPFKGVIKEVHVDAGAAINVNDLLIEFKKKKPTQQNTQLIKNDAVYRKLNSIIFIFYKNYSNGIYC